MRISDWSSDVCSSDLQPHRRHHPPSHKPDQVQARLGRRHVGGFPGHNVASAVTETASAAQACEVTPYVGPGLALSPGAPTWPDRKSVAQGKRVLVRVALGGRRTIQKHNTIE